ncbi:MAG: NAD(P)H-dependent oxidoreductase [Sphingomonadaceae bacterium]
MNILHIDSCALGDHSISRQMTARAVASLCELAPQSSVVYRDVAAAPLAHISGPLMQALRQQWHQDIPMSADLRAEVQLSAALWHEFIDADVLVLGAPLGSFFLPTTLQTWLERLLLLGTRPMQQRERATRVLLVSSSSLGEPLEPSRTKALEDHLTTTLRHLGVGIVETFNPGNAVRNWALQETEGTPDFI